MKKLFFILLTFLPLSSYCDTLDYWSVYLNDSLVGQYNSVSTNNEITLSREAIDENDTLSIVYGNDHPCANCEYYYAIKGTTTGIKVLVDRKKQILEGVHFPIFKLKKARGSTKFEAFVYENSYTSNNNLYVTLFKLKLE